MPASLLPALNLARKDYGPTMTNNECVEMLNRVAWDYRADGWGLSSKPSGNRGIRYDGTPCALDILYHKPSQTVYDCLRDAGGVSVPTWQTVEVYDFAGRPWVAPVVPQDQTEPPEPPPSDDLAALTARVEVLERQMQVVSAATLDLIKRVDGLEHAEYRVKIASGRTFGHGHSVEGPVTRVK